MLRAFEHRTTFMFRFQMGRRFNPSEEYLAFKYRTIFVWFLDGRPLDHFFQWFEYQTDSIGWSLYLVLFKSDLKPNITL